jgi:hypothetical protein
LALGSGGHQGRKAFQPALDVDLGALLEEELDRLRIRTTGGVHQRGPAISVPRVELRTVFQEVSNHGGVAIERRPHHGCAFLGIGDVDAGAFRHQTLDLRQVADVGGLHERLLHLGQRLLSLSGDGHADGAE